MSAGTREVRCVGFALLLHAAQVATYKTGRCLFIRRQTYRADHSQPDRQSIRRIRASWERELQRCIARTGAKRVRWTGGVGDSAVQGLTARAAGLPPGLRKSEDVSIHRFLLLLLLRPCRPTVATSDCSHLVVRRPWRAPPAHLPPHTLYTPHPHPCEQV
jgi:hypothetical protein